MSFKNKIIKWNLLSLVASIVITLLIGLFLTDIFISKYFGNNFNFKDAINSPMIEPFFIQLLFSLALTFVIVLSISNIIVYYKISKHIIKPLEDIRYCIKEMALGNFLYELNYISMDEIGDISNYIQQLQNRLKQYLDQINEQKQNNAELLTSISHDLRTPLTTILGYTDGILDGVANTDIKKTEYLNKIKKKALDIEYLIDQLLLSSKLSSNKISYNFEETNIIEFINEIINEIQIDLYNNNTTIKCINNSKFYNLSIDKARFKRVVLNIISNSIKYKQKDNCEILITFESISNSIVISFKDNSKGIPQDKLPYIFDSFYRCDDSRIDSSASSGIGLSIAKLIVTGHNGKIWAKSTVNKGTVIYISLPIDNT